MVSAHLMGTVNNIGHNRIEQKMFSTPQSKAFFSQEIVKGKLIAEQLHLINNIYDRVWESKNGIAEIIKILWQHEQVNEAVAEKLHKISEAVHYAMQIVSESNEQFMFEVSLRSDIKQLEHSFFKNIMVAYEDKIKQLKHWLLVLETDVQQMEQKGLLPYVENPSRNNILASKTKYYQDFRDKLKAINEMIALFRNAKLSKVIVGIVDSIIHRKDNLSRPNLPTEQSQSKKAPEPHPRLDKSNQLKEGLQECGDRPLGEKKLELIKQDSQKKRDQLSGITQMLKILQNWNIVNNWKLKKYNREFKERIQALSHCNKTLKEGIRNYKRIMGYEQNEAMVRSGQIDLTREEAIDFLREMSDDLQCKFARRNIYMIISIEPTLKLTKSCTDLSGRDEEAGEGENGRVLREVHANLNNSFLDQCSYLISDRFLAEEDENQQMMV